MMKMPASILKKPFYCKYEEKYSLTWGKRVIIIKILIHSKTAILTKSILHPFSCIFNFLFFIFHNTTLPIHSNYDYISYVFAIQNLFVLSLLQLIFILFSRQQPHSRIEPHNIYTHKTQNSFAFSFQTFLGLLLSSTQPL